VFIGVYEKFENDYWSVKIFFGVVCHTEDWKIVKILAEWLKSSPLIETDWYENDWTIHSQLENEEVKSGEIRWRSGLPWQIIVCRLQTVNWSSLIVITRIEPNSQFQTQNRTNSAAVTCHLCVKGQSNPSIAGSRLHRWGPHRERWNIKINEDKTQGIYFFHSPRPPVSHLTLNGRYIQFVNNIKYLGVIFYKKITWRLHIQMMEAKTFRIFIRVYSLFRSERLSANIKLTLHKTH
jgi:hypothetical protein